jgi:hypothetical protein
MLKGLANWGRPDLSPKNRDDLDRDRLSRRNLITSSASTGDAAMVVKRVGILSMGKVLGCVHALLGLIVGGLFTFLSLFLSLAAGREARPVSLLFGVGAIVILPVLYGVGGFIGGIILAVLYNFVASVIGGIEIEFKRAVDTHA